MLKNEPKQLSLYSTLYNRIPENHILKLINGAVDFSFINELLENSYCKYYGRPAKEPEMMSKLLIIQYLYNLSDIQGNRRSYASKRNHEKLPRKTYHRSKE